MRFRGLRAAGIVLLLGWASQGGADGVDPAFYREILAGTERAQGFTSYRYGAEDLPLGWDDSARTDWNLTNYEYPAGAVSVEELPGGGRGLRIGQPGQPGRYSANLRYVWDAEVGATHVVSVRMAVDYEHGNPANGAACFWVLGPGGRSSVDVSRNVLEDPEGQAHFRILQRTDGRDVKADVTEAVQKALGGGWEATGRHTYTLKWKTTGSVGDVPFDLYVDGRPVLSFMGYTAPPEANPGLGVSFEYGAGTALIEYVDWIMVPPAGKAPQAEYLVLRGMGFNRLRVAELVESLPAEKVETIDLQSGLVFGGSRSADSLSRYPGDHVLAGIQGFLLADVAAGVFGERLMERMIGRVQAGARLVVLGGIGAYGKGHYRGSRLEEVLPVTAADNPWDIFNAGAALRLEPTKRGKELLPLAWEDAPTVRYLHRTELREGAEVLVTAGGQPVLSRRKVGQGYGYAFTGAPFGVDPQAFWKWADWPTLMRTLLQAE